MFTLANGHFNTKLNNLRVSAAGLILHHGSLGNGNKTWPGAQGLQERGGKSQTRGAVEA